MKGALAELSLQSLTDRGRETRLLHPRPVEEKKNYHNGHRKQQYSLPGSDFKFRIFDDRESYFHLRCFAEALTYCNSTRAVSKIVQLSSEIMLVCKKYTQDIAKMARTQNRNAE